MGQRLKLQQLLEDLLPEGNTNVYFQPPENVSMRYPCFVFQRDYAETKHADNVAYSHTKRYQVTYIDADPDSTVPDELVSKIPMTSFQRFFVSEQLNHDVYQVFF